MKLKLSVDADNIHLRTIGEIFIPPLQETSIAVVRYVNARREDPHGFVLNPGVYEYHFHVDDGSGAFTITVTPEGTTVPIASKAFDTKFGFAGRVMRFEVKA